MACIACVSGEPLRPSTASQFPKHSSGLFRPSSPPRFPQGAADAPTSLSHAASASDAGAASLTAASGGGGAAGAAGGVDGGGEGEDGEDDASEQAAEEEEAEAADTARDRAFVARLLTPQEERQQLAWIQFRVPSDTNFDALCRPDEPGLMGVRRRNWTTGRGRGGTQISGETA